MDAHGTANEREYLNGLIEKVVGGVYEVANVLGPGFLEKVYEQALAKELRLRGIPLETQAAMRVTYKDEVVGTYYADLLVDGRLIVEIKTVERLAKEHLAQCLNYLNATGTKIALLVNFKHARVEWKRVVNDF